MLMLGTVAAAAFIALTKLMKGWSRAPPTLPSVPVYWMLSTMSPVERCCTFSSVNSPPLALAGSELFQSASLSANHW